MPIPQFTVLSGAINGTNPTFSTPVPYTAGSTAVYLNGQLIKNAGGDPWNETSPSTGIIDISAAECIPRPGDVLAAFFLDTSGNFTGSVLTLIQGTIFETATINGNVTVKCPVAGSLSPDPGISASIIPLGVGGSVGKAQTLSGTIRG